MEHLWQTVRGGLARSLFIILIVHGISTEAYSQDVPPPSTTGQSSSADQQNASQKNNSLDLYGFVMLDSGYDFGQIDPNWFDVMRPTKLPSFPNEFGPNGNVYFSVRATRFGVQTTTATKYGDLKTVFEFDLFGVGVDAGQTTFRLRKAYGELWQFGAGQTNSAFMDIDVFPNSLDYWGPNGMVFFRNIQLRWMPVHTDRHEVILALERPGASGDQGVYAGRIELQGIKPHFVMPDISGHVRVSGDWGHLQVAGIARKIGWVDTTPNSPFLLGDHVWGWGVNVTSNLKFSASDTARLAVVYGKGIENYMNDAPIDIGVKNNPGSLTRPILGVPLPVLGAVGFLDHNWGKKASTAIGYSLVNIYNSNAQTASDFHQGHYALANLLIYPVDKVMFGAEFQFGRRVNFRDGFNVNDYKVQFSVKYDWKKVFAF